MEGQVARCDWTDDTTGAWQRAVCRQVGSDNDCMQTGLMILAYCVAFNGLLHDTCHVAPPDTWQCPLLNPVLNLLHGAFNNGCKTAIRYDAPLDSQQLCFQTRPAKVHGCT